MHPLRKQKLVLITLLIVVLACAVALITYALRQNISLFYSPSQIIEGIAPRNQLIRVGGMVVKGSIVRTNKNLLVEFKITDYKNTIRVIYDGILPDLFREGQGIVAQGKLIDSNLVRADEVLAKHDENYMPREVRDSLKK